MGSMSLSTRRKVERKDESRREESLGDVQLRDKHAQSSRRADRSSTASRVRVNNAKEKGGDGGEADWLVLEALALTFTRPMQKTTLVWTLGPLTYMQLSLLVSYHILTSGAKLVVKILHSSRWYERKDIRVNLKITPLNLHHATMS